jgi:cation diffusion facilitator CzcD-associated flavoprotein CzcO
MKQSCDVAIIGAGPYGLSVAAHLGMRGVNTRIFGKPLGTWASHMPKNMTLKSEGFASNLSAPTSDFTMKAWSGRRGIAYADQGLPISLDNFLAYGDAFRRRFVPGLEDVQVTRLERKGDGFLPDARQRRDIRSAQCRACGGRDVVRAHAGCFDGSSEGHDLAQLRSPRYRPISKDSDVAVIGTGSSAIDLAHQLRESGASPHIIGRADHIQFNCTPDPDREKLLYRCRIRLRPSDAAGAPISARKRRFCFTACRSR